MQRDPRGALRVPARDSLNSVLFCYILATTHKRSEGTVLSSRDPVAYITFPPRFLLIQGAPHYWSLPFFLCGIHHVILCFSSEDFINPWNMLNYTKVCFSFFFSKKMVMSMSDWLLHQRKGVEEIRFGAQILFRIS